jgi:hypothetical protein
VHHYTLRFFPLARVASVALAVLAGTASHALTPQEAVYVGDYRGGSADTSAQLALLDDSTFCYTFKAGGMNMLMAGRWNAENQGIRLRQVRREQTLFPAFSRKVGGQGDVVEFDFHGPSMSNANGPVFAVAADDTPPATFRPLFSEGNRGWSENFKLPPMPTDAARYFYVGTPVEAMPGKPAVVAVVQYRLEGANSVRVAFDQLQAMPPMDQRGEIKDDILYLAGSRFGKRGPLAPGVLSAVRAGCIQPALDTQAEPALVEQGVHKPLVPGKTFTVSPSAIEGKPFFDARGG